MNKMQEIKIEKITLNLGTGKNADLLEKGMKLLGNITGVKPVKTITKKRIPTWGLRPGLPIGCKVTLRGEKWNDLLKRLLAAKDGTLSKNQIDENGNIAFGVPEYIDVPEVKYDPEIGVIGFEVCVTLVRNGFRVKKRKIKKGKIGNRQKVTRDDAIAFMKKNFEMKIEEEE